MDIGRALSHPPAVLAAERQLALGGVQLGRDQDEVDAVLVG